MADKRKTSIGESTGTGVTSTPGGLDDIIKIVSPIMMGGLPAGEAAAVDAQLRADLEHVLLPVSWPGYDAQTFSSDLAASGEALSVYARRVKPAVQLDPQALKPLFGVADFLDRQAAEAGDGALVLFVPGGFQVLSDGRFRVTAPYLRLLAADATLGKTTGFQRKEGYLWLHPDLNGNVRLSDADPLLRVRYGWALFLAESWLDVSPAARRQLLDDLSKCRHRNPQIPPKAPDIITAALTEPVTEPTDRGCRVLLENLANVFMHNPLHLNADCRMDCEYQQSHYSLPGRYKKSPTNEDRVGALNTEGATLIFVADGVSTADLGSGEEAAELASGVVRDRRFNLVRWAADMKKTNAKNWSSDVHNSLNQIFNDASNAIADKLNNIARETGLSEPTEHPMCTTLSVAIVLGDQSVIYTLGDSPALLYQQHTRSLMKLSVDHNVGSERECASSLVDCESADDESLTRVAGAIWTEGKQFEPRNEKPFKLEVQLRPGDILLLASDGLLKCIEPYDQTRALVKVEQKIIEIVSKRGTLRDLVQQLTQMADEAASNDNITVNAVKVILGETNGKGAKNG